MASRSYNSPSGRSHPPPSPSAYFASSQAARLQSSPPPTSLSPGQPKQVPSQYQQQQQHQQQLQQQLQQQQQQHQYLIPPRPDNSRKTSVSSTSSTSSTSSSSSGISPSPTPKSYSPASLSNQQSIVDSYRNRYASYLAATWGISPSAAGAELSHQLHTRPGQHWPHPEQH